MLILILDDYHLGDPMFAGRLARAVAKRARPVVIVHDSGEAGGRALEEIGRVVQRDEGGVWPVRTEEERRLVERATRDLNRELVAEMSENGVAGVRITGIDRGLLVLDSEGEVHAPRGDWVRSLTENGALPVVASLAKGGEGAVVEVAAKQAGMAIARPGDHVGFLSKDEQKVQEKDPKRGILTVRGPLNALLREKM